MSVKVSHHQSMTSEMLNRIASKNHKNAINNKQRLLRESKQEELENERTHDFFIESVHTARSNRIRKNLGDSLREKIDSLGLAVASDAILAFYGEVNIMLYQAIKEFSIIYETDHVEEEKGETIENICTKYKLNPFERYLTLIYAANHSNDGHSDHQNQKDKRRVFQKKISELEAKESHFIAEEMEGITTRIQNKLDILQNKTSADAKNYNAKYKDIILEITKEGGDYNFLFKLLFVGSAETLRRGMDGGLSDSVRQYEAKEAIGEVIAMTSNIRQSITWCTCIEKRIKENFDGKNKDQVSHNSNVTLPKYMKDICDVMEGFDVSKVIARTATAIGANVYKLAKVYLQVIQDMPDKFFIKNTDRESAIRRMISYLISLESKDGEERLIKIKAKIAAL